MAFLLPIQVFAETTPEPKPEESVTFDSLGEATNNANIVSELKERRDEYTKHFRMDDGTIMAVTYDCPVHYKNNKGKWVEYDNSLIAESEATPDEIAPEPLTNKKSNINIELAPDTKTDNLVKISSKKGNITWKYTGANKSSVKVKNSNKKHKENEKFTSIDKLTSKANYKSIYKNVDLDCIVSTTGVKENIVLENADAQNEFYIEYNIKGLKAEQIDKQTIKLYKGKKEVYSISAPCMYDADGNISTDLNFKIISNKANVLKVKLTADKGFLNSWGRSYPVTIDPEVSLNGYVNTETAEVKSSQADTVQGQSTHFHVGDVYSGLIKLKNVQENYSDKNIVSAKLNLFPMSTSSEMEIEAYPITSSWTNSTATYNNVSYDSEVIDYVKTKANSSDVVSLDLTKYVKKWANGTVANNGVYLKSTDTATDFGGYQCYFPNKRPTFIVKYKEYTGSESNLTSHTVPCGQNADANVSDYTGALTIKQKIYEEKGLRIPLNIYATHHSTNIAQRSYIGKGWHMSFDKRLTNTGTYYVYLDGDAVEHYFRIVSGKTELEDEDDLGLTLKIKSSSIEINNGSTIESFSIPANNETKYIQTEKDSNNSNNSITYTYGSTGYLSNIVSAQHTYTFSYSTVTSDGESVKICNNIKKDNSTIISFSYYTGYALSYGIKSSDGKRSTFSYNNNLISSVRQYSTSDSQNGQKLGFTYTSGKVTKITEYGKNDASRKSLTVKYNTNNTTEFTDLNGNKETYTFDDYGNTISTLNANGMITNGSDSGSLGIATGSDSYTKNYIEVSNEPTALGTNQYYRKVNGTIGNQTSSGGTVTIDENNSYLGSKSIKVNHSGASQIYTYAMHENNADDIKGKTVTLSAYVKTNNITEGSLSGAAGAIVKFKALNGSTTLLDRNSVALQDTVTGSEWERISLTVDVPSNTTSYRIYFALRNAQGTAWFDCMQLEEGDVMNDYNALANSDFTSTSDWTYKYKDTGDTSFHTTQIPLNNDGDVLLSGKGCEPQSAQAQNVEEETEPTVATEVRTETETVDNDTVEETDAYGNVTKTMQGKVTRTYRRTYEVTEATEPTTSSSNSSGNDAGIDSVGECNNYIYQTLDVNKKSVTFNISGTASAASVPLNSNYRTFGIALKVKYSGDSDYTENHYQEFNAYTDATQNIILSVTPDEPDRVVEKVAFAFVYGYNKNEMIIKNAMLNFAYDYQFGGNEENDNSSSGTNSADAINEEIISESVSTAQTYMETNTAYNSAGNYITSETDEAGHTTSYSYDSDGNKTSVTDPKNNTTSYTYDTYGNILSVASGSSSYNNTYTGTGQLSTISNSGTSYSFEYDNFDNVTKVKVGNQTLITNIYDSLCDKLTRVTYGNGQSLYYYYDDFGRITDINVHNGTMASYSYNKKGLITKYEDHWLNQTTYFFYDCNGNMIAKYAESEDKDLAFNISFDSDGNTVEQTNVNGRLQNIIRGTDDEENEYVSYDGIKVTTETDDFGRTTKTDTHYEGDLDYSPFYTTYGYKNGSSTNSTTNIVNSVKHYTKTASNYPDHKIAQYDYTYDANGNITQVTLNDTVIAKYTYDSLNQLKTSADKNANEFVEYTYDTKGNITQKKNYSLTSSLTKGTLQDTKTYTYGDTNWGDKLTSYNGTTITYDNIGNPTSYRDGMTMSWMVGRSLSQVTKSNKTYSFKYNADGLRTEKKCVTDGDTAHYYYDSNGNMIAYRRNNGAVVYFYYDSQGNVTSMSFEGTKYFFIKNIQGDVEKIVTHQGNVAVTYKYDAWGKLISKTDNTVYGIGELNPFRYRGYIYDDETGLYYLKSRYYDPITGRFLNADDTDFIAVSEKALGTNIFSYCENNPISYKDSDGQGAVIGAIFGALITAVTFYLEYKLGLRSWSWGWFVFEVALGAALGAIGGYISGWAKCVRVMKHVKIPRLLRSLKNPVLNFLIPLITKGVSHIIKKIVKKFSMKPNESWGKYAKRILKV
jgi:RHS repeat-associated protein